MNSPPLEQLIGPQVAQSPLIGGLPQPPRFVGLDVHKDYATVAILDAQLNTVSQPRRVSIGELEGWTRRNLKPTDKVVLEATTNAWHLFDLLQPLVASVTVADPRKTKMLMNKRVKTDNGDAIQLARLLAVGMVPEVWVPPHEVRELRSLVAHRRRLVRHHTQAQNRLRSALNRHSLLPPEGEPFSACHRSWWEALELSSSEKLRVRQDLAMLDYLKPLIEEATAELTRLSTVEPWADQVPFLLQIAGIGVLSAMTLLAAIGDVSRFPSAKQLVGYSGLGASVHASGQTYRTGKITKEGRREMRATSVECAWRAVDNSAYWKEEFERLADRIGKLKAIVAIARKMLVVVWHVLTKKEADRHAQPEKVASKFLHWAYDLRREGRQGIRAGEFAGCKLKEIRMKETVYSVRRSGRTVRLGPEDE